MVFNIFTTINFRIVSQLPKETAVAFSNHCPFSSAFLSLPITALGNYCLLSVYMNFPVLDVSCNMWYFVNGCFHFT